MVCKIGKDLHGCAIVTKELGEYFYLDKLSVDAQSQGIGVSDILWREITKRYKTLVWRSRWDNPVNKW